MEQEKLFLPDTEYLRRSKAHLTKQLHPNTFLRYQDYFVAFVHCKCMLTWVDRLALKICFVPRPPELPLLNLIPAVGIFLAIALISKLTVTADYNLRLTFSQTNQHLTFT